MANRPKQVRVFALGAEGKLLDLTRRTRTAKASKQLVTDPFQASYDQYGLVAPPYDLDNLNDLRELNAVHAAAIEQKALDITGLGWRVDPAEHTEAPSSQQRLAVMRFLEDPNPDSTLTEMLELTWGDYETLGWGMLEVVTDALGRPAELWHVPAATCRMHLDNKRIVQIRAPGGASTGYDYRWFKLWGDPKNYSLKTGEEGDYPPEQSANAVLLFRRTSGRSSYYGIPSYVASLGAIAALTAVQDYNLSFFDNWAIPANLVVVKGPGVATDLEPVLTAALKEGYKRTTAGDFQAFKTLVLPLPQLDTEVEVHQLAAPTEAGFQSYVEMLMQQVLIGHRVPPQRLGWSIVGQLGGSNAREVLQTYKDAVVERGQVTLEHRFNRFLRDGFGVSVAGKKELDWVWKLADIDISDRDADRRHWIEMVQYGAATPNEMRVAMGAGEEADNPDGNQFFIAGGLRPMSQLNEMPGGMPGLPPGASEEETVTLALQEMERRLEQKLQELGGPGAEGLAQSLNDIRRRLDGYDGLARDLNALRGQVETLLREAKRARR